MQTSTYAAVLLLTACAARGAEWHRVASFHAQPIEISELEGGAAPYIFNLHEIPTTALPADAADRHVVYGLNFGFHWDKLNPAASYRIKAVFLSDRQERVVRVEANDLILEKHLALPQAQLLEREWLVPAGKLGSTACGLSFKRISGPNAVLSRLDVFSTDPTPLTKAPPREPELDKIIVSMPQLTPRPVMVAGVTTPMVSLNGVWKFNPLPPEGFEKFSTTQTRDWKTIEVPGEWFMQGFVVPTNAAAAYWRTFDMPADWHGHCIKLRFDTVHSDCQVFVNGQAVGTHDGCFTAFEFDVSNAIKPGRNILALAVKSESLSDTLDSATSYAAHQLGGITRKVQVFALPKSHIATQTVEADYDAATETGTLKTSLQLARTGGAELKLRLRLLSPTNITHNTLTILGMNAQHDSLLPQMTIPKVVSWDPEHPRLYTLQTELLENGNVIEQIEQRVGFRRITIRGNQLFVNNTPVKLRGACRHEAHPTRGRSLTPELWRQDAELFRGANVNYIRTSHYPPPEEFLDLCDEYGFFVECEAPLCWVHGEANPVWKKWDEKDQIFFAHLMRANLENLVANRNHPCVTIWSLANESKWTPLFAEVNRRMKAADPTRPTSFHDQCWGSGNNAGSTADIAVYHYPSEDGPAKCDHEKRPVLFGEYCHVECYDRRELATDPGVRDDWGRNFAQMYGLMYQHPGCLGGAIWAGIDEVFCLPNGKCIGYGPWGCICDGWRRAKPETWHIKKTYSPIRVLERELPVPATGEPMHIRLQNRYNFTNLREVNIAWQAGAETGTITAALAAQTEGAIAIPVKQQLQSGDTLRLAFTDPRGFVCDEEAITIGTKLMVHRNISTNVTGVTWSLDPVTGHLQEACLNGHTVLLGPPAFMLLPHSKEACSPVDLGIWKPLNTLATNNEVTGSISLKPNGSLLNIAYDFTANVTVNPRQWGLVLYLPRRYDTLAWQRDAQWSFYPSDHIGRPAGTAHANARAQLPPYARQVPSCPWSADPTDLGGNDFTSTKAFIREATLHDHDGYGVRVISDGHQCVRAFVDGERVGLLVTGFHCAGDSFESSFIEHKPIKKGDHLKDKLVLELIAQ